LSASTEPAGDAELLRLLNSYTLDTLDIGAVMGTEGLRLRGDNAVRACKQMASRAALLAHIAEHYVRRDSMHLQQRPGGGVALVETKWLDEPPDTDPPIVSGPLSRRAVTIRGRGPARAARYSKGELADGSD